MTISFDDLMKCVKSLLPADPSAGGEPLYIRFTPEKFKAKETITYTAKDGVIFALDIDEDGELCGIEII